MNKPKAPNDMSLGELLEEYKIERKCASCKYDQYCATKEPLILGRTDTIPSCMTGRIWMERKLTEPAPNPFTPDQLAWMREEQRAGYRYASKDSDGGVVISKEIPDGKGFREWNRYGLSPHHVSNFLDGVLSWDDPEPLCFADYAPLDSPCEGGEKE